MNDYIKKAEELGGYLVRYNTTVNKEVTVRLKKLNYTLYEKVAKILAENKSVRHIRG